MNNEFLKKAFDEAIYSRKEGTTTSYYWQGGSKLFPSRLSISKNLFTDVQRKGRAITNGLLVGQCKGQFTKIEESPYKVCEPYNITTSIWQSPYYLQFIGYGTLGFSGEKGITDLGDLMLFYSEDSDWQKIRIFYFAGIGAVPDPDRLEEVFRYASTLI